jgi:hypothetical protein
MREKKATERKSKGGITRIRSIWPLEEERERTHPSALKALHSD